MHITTKNNPTFRTQLSFNFPFLRCRHQFPPRPLDFPSFTATLCLSTFWMLPSCRNGVLVTAIFVGERRHLARYQGCDPFLFPVDAGYTMNYFLG